jgi:hypothetical protein
LANESISLRNEIDALIASRVLEVNATQPTAVEPDLFKGGTEI